MLASEVSPSIARDKDDSFTTSCVGDANQLASGNCAKDIASELNNLGLSSNS